MIEVRLKVPSTSIIIKGNIKHEEIIKQMGKLFLTPENNLLNAETRSGDAIMIPGSNIAYMKNVKES